MEAVTLKCPMCGASCSTQANCCDHCNSRLATVSCPSCFGLMFVGAQFCSHCGAHADRSANRERSRALPCPRCSDNLETVTLGETQLLECPRCAGIWAEAATLEQICLQREKQSVVLGMATATPPPEPGTVPTEIRYVPCPQCAQLMNRVQFARCSQVIVDVCKPHGTWFDRNELRRIVEFIRGGGMEKARTREIEELEARRRQAAAAQSVSTGDPFISYNVPNSFDVFDAIEAAADVVSVLLRP